MKQTNPTGWSDRFDELVLFRRIADGEPIFPKDVDQQMIKVIKSFISSELTATEQKTLERVKQVIEEHKFTGFHNECTNGNHEMCNQCLFKDATNAKLGKILKTLSQ